MTGSLYVVPTPLGNLEDITLRAIRILGQVDTIAAEDTRRSRVLLTHLGIKARLVSYHQHAKRDGINRILQALESGDVALISDAGTPSLADPGFELIQAALQEGVRIEVLPGPSAVTTAVVLAAIPARGFLFMGFLPRKRTDCIKRLQEVAGLPYSLVVFEAPHRLLRTLRLAREVLGDRLCVGARELTKVYEEAIRGHLSDLIQRLDTPEPRGEWTLVIGPSEFETRQPSDPDVEEALRRIVAEGVSPRDAVQTVSKALGVPRSDVYPLWLSLQALESEEGPEGP